MAQVTNSIMFTTGGGGTTITVVANYSALPDPTTVSGKFYWCENSQGTSWLPGSLGGTYYNSGMYYSNGVSWEFMNVPYQATQAEVNTGTNTDKFVTPSTFNNASKWATKEDSANKSTSTSDSASNVKFPVWSAILSYFDASRIRTILGISTLSGSNTGDQDLSGLMVKSANGSDISNIKTFRANLGVDKLTSNGDSNYTILSTDKSVVTSATLTAPRTWTLPLANSVNSGYEIIVADLFGAVNSTNTLTISRAGSDTINGANSVTIGASYGMRRLTSDGVSKWTFDGGVMRISDYIGTTLTANVLVATDANSKLQPLATSTYPSLTEVTYVKGVTSAIQTQLNNRIKLVSRSSAPTSALTGTTTETQMAQITLPIGTFSLTDFIKIRFQENKTTATSTCTWRIKISTSATMPAGNTDRVAVFTDATGIRTQVVKRTFWQNGGNLTGVDFTTSNVNDETVITTTGLSTQAFNNTTTQYYLYISAQLTSASDSVTLQNYEITN